MGKYKIILVAVGGFLSSLWAQNNTIDALIPRNLGDKATLEIHYSGEGPLQFFAVDALDRELIIDFPGLTSRVPFDGLHIDGVKSIQQWVLDPGSNTGLSVSFKLDPGTEFEFFPGNKSPLVIYFDLNPSKGELAEATPQREPLGTVGQVLVGRNGAEWLHRVGVQSSSEGFSLMVEYDASRTFGTFTLPNPQRFVIDLKGVKCALDRDLLTFSEGPVRQLRIKQFQVHPEPITRLVLEHDGSLMPQVTPLDNGVAFHSGSIAAQVAVSSSQATVDPGFGSNPEEQPAPHALESDTPSLALVEEPSTTTGPSMEESTVPSSPLAQDTESSAVVAVVDPDPTAELSDELISGGNQSSPNHQEMGTIVSNEETLVSKEIPPVSSAPEVIDAVSGAPAADSNVDVQVVEERQEVSVDQVASLENQEQSIPVISNQEEKMEAMTVEKTVVAAEAPKADDLPLTPEKKTHRLPFLAEIDVDETLDSFVNQEKTIYHEMKEAKPLRPVNPDILLTNDTIREGLEQPYEPLRETTGLQEDEALANAFESSSLFKKSEEETFQAGTLAGGQRKYMGFEIQGIDVVNVPVTDLLRFFADQVGFNLYVDPSVSDMTATYKFTNIPWDQALEIILRNAGLDYQYDNGVLRVATTRKFQEEEEARRALEEARALSVPRITVNYPLSYAKVTEIAPLIEPYLSERGLLLMDERTNMLIIEDIPQKMDAVGAVIKKLDTPVAQVTIESRVVETTKRMIKELGVQWGLGAKYAPEYGTQTGLTFPNRVTIGGPTIGLTNLNGLEGGYAVNLPVLDENPSGIGFTFGNVLDTFKLDISLQMIESNGLGQIISAPKVTTQNNKTALIKNGQKVPVQTIQRGTITVKYIDAVLELEVTPHITSEKTIIMDMVVDKSEPDFTRTVLGNPVINVRRAETRVMVKDGGTAVIGGIYVLNEQNNNRGIPGLKDVPFIKRLFGNEYKELQNQELLIFVTPRIVKY
jgi:type IV pilus assembly protein PilQ